MKYHCTLCDWHGEELESNGSFGVCPKCRSSDININEHLKKQCEDKKPYYAELKITNKKGEVVDNLLIVNIIQLDKRDSYTLKNGDKIIDFLMMGEMYESKDPS